MKYVFSDRLYHLRKSRKMTQKELAERLNVSVSAICSYETGKNFPSLIVLQNIATVFDIKCDYLLGFENRKWLVVDGLDDKQIENIKSIIQDFKLENQK